MSYSFSVRAASKTAASAKVAEKLAEVVMNQSMHSKDQGAAQAAADAFIALVRDDADQDIVVSLSGSVSWNDASELSSANVCVGASLAAKESA